MPIIERRNRKINPIDLPQNDKKVLLEHILDEHILDKKGNLMSPMEYDIFDYFKYNLIKKVKNQYVILNSGDFEIVGFFIANTSTYSENLFQDFSFYIYDKNTWNDINDLQIGEIIKKNILVNFKKEGKQRLQTSNIWTHTYKDSKLPIEYTSFCFT